MRLNIRNGQMSAGESNNDVDSCARSPAPVSIPCQVCQALDPVPPRRGSPQEAARQRSGIRFLACGIAACGVHGVCDCWSRRPESLSAPLPLMSCIMAAAAYRGAEERSTTLRLERPARMRLAGIAALRAANGHAQKQRRQAVTSDDLCLIFRKLVPSLGDPWPNPELLLNAARSYARPLVRLDGQRTRRTLAYFQHSLRNHWTPAPRAE